MLVRSNRLTNERDFQRLFRSGTRVRGPFASLTYTSNRSARNRVAIVVSAKVDKRATVRNRLRRRAYEEIRRVMADMKQGMDIMVRVSPDAVKASRKQWNASVVQLLKRAGLVKHEISTKQSNLSFPRKRESRVVADVDSRSGRE